jgi:hypothetical protein
MSKSLTLSMSLALALGFTGVSFAGHGDCATCGIASPQGVVASPQGYETCDTCAPAKKHHFKLSIPSCLKPKPKMYTYEWVLKKKRVHGHAATASCDTCGTAVTPSAQYGSPQGTYAAPQASYAPAYGAPQTALLPTSEMKAPMAPTPTGDSVPAAPAAPAPAAPAPPAPAGAQSSLLFLAPAGN